MMRARGGTEGTHDHNLEILKFTMLHDSLKWPKNTLEKGIQYFFFEFQHFENDQKQKKMF